VVGYDDIELASTAAVPLTTVRQPRHMLGQAAAGLLLTETDKRDHQHRQIVLTPELVVRESG
jgi:LacI family transcriptional regulator